jgi:hypothetical protein
VRHAVAAWKGATGGRIVRIYVSGGGSDQFGLIRAWSRLETNRQPTPGSTDADAG